MNFFISVDVSLLFDSKNGHEEITQEMINKIEFGTTVCKKMGKKDGPTHVVTSLTRGFRLVVSHIPGSIPNKYGSVQELRSS